MGGGESVEKKGCGEMRKGWMGGWEIDRRWKEVGFGVKPMGGFE